jgi:hypothetical protein
MGDRRSSGTTAACVSLLTLATIATTAPLRAAPPDKATCASAYEQAQRLRRDRKLVKAHEALLVCVQDSCSEFIRTDCATWIKEVEASLPTVVFEAQGADGARIADVTVSSGGEVLASRLDGKAVPLDPGERVLRFEHAGAKTIEQTFVVREGEKLQKISVVFPDVGSAPAPPASTTAPVPTPPPSASSTIVAPPVDAGPPQPAPIPWTVWALGGVGVVGLGVFTGFAISGYSGIPALDRCKSTPPYCSESDIQAVRTKYLIGDIGLAVGVVAIGAAATIYFFGRPDAKGRPAVGASFTPDGARAFVGGRF